MMPLSDREDRCNRTWVTMVHWGDPTRTQAAVQAVRASTHFPPERIFVVDNGSASGISPTDAHVLTLSENRGYAAGVNYGLQASLRSGARYVLVLNNDLFLPPGAVEALLSAVHDPRARIGCVGAVLDEGDVRPVYGGGRVSWWRGRAHLAHSPEVALDYISGACLLITKACVEDVGGLPEQYFLYWEDVSYGFAVRKRGWKIAVAPTPIVSHPRSQRLSDSKMKTYYLVRNGALFVRQHAPRRSRRWLVSLERPRVLWAKLHRRWEVVRALNDARAGITGPLPEGTSLDTPP